MHAALTAYRVAVREGRYTHQHEAGGFDHLDRRMRERDIDLADVLRAIALGRICTFAPRGWDWIGGGYLLAGLMVYVQAPAPPGRGLNFADLAPSICSTWRIDAVEPSRPPPARVRELVLHCSSAP